MKSKKTSTHIADVTKSNKGTDAADKPRLVIPKRSIIVPVSAIDSDDDTTTAPAPEPSAPKSKPVGKSVQPEAMTTGPGTAPASDTPSPAAPEPDEPQEADEFSPAAASAADTGASPAADAPPASPPAANTPVPDAKPASKAAPHVRKALDDAKRAEELQGLINNREFFVPINSVARKRSLKVSIALTFLELLLGIVLLDLMLDAGVIELIQKIPHTHLFDVH